MVKVPCCIKEGEKCSEPFCQYMYFSMRANEAFYEWIAECKAEIEVLKKEGKIKEVKKEEKDDG
jgi:hypothetical protein